MKYFVATKSILLTGKILHLITEVATLANLLCLHYTMIIDMHTLLLLILARSVLNNNLLNIKSNQKKEGEQDRREGRGFKKPVQLPSSSASCMQCIEPPRHTVPLSLGEICAAVQSMHSCGFLLPSAPA